MAGKSHAIALFRPSLRLSFSICPGKLSVFIEFSQKIRAMQHWKEALWKRLKHWHVRGFEFIF